MPNPMDLGSQLPGTAMADGGGEPLGSVKEGVEEEYKPLHVLVPARVRNHVKAQAALSGLSFKEYMKRFLQEAFPYSDADKPEGKEGKQV